MKRKRAGFTVIELLVTVIIIAILAAFILPYVDRCKEQARRIVCTGNLKQMHTGILMYVQDWNGWFPRYGKAIGSMTSTDFDNVRISGVWGQLGVLYDLRYIDNPQIFYCPSEKAPNRKYNQATWSSPPANIDGNYDYWGAHTGAAPLPRDSIRENPGKALIGDLNVSWGDTALSLASRTKKTHVGEGQNILHIGGDVRWYPRNKTKSTNALYQGIPITNFSTVDD